MGRMAFHNGHMQESKTAKLEISCIVMFTWLADRWIKKKISSNPWLDGKIFKWNGIRVPKISMHSFGIFFFFQKNKMKFLMSGKNFQTM